MKLIDAERKTLLLLLNDPQIAQKILLKFKNCQSNDWRNFQHDFWLLKSFFRKFFLSILPENSRDRDRWWIWKGELDWGQKIHHKQWKKWFNHHIISEHIVEFCKVERKLTLSGLSRISMSCRYMRDMMIIFVQLHDTAINHTIHERDYDWNKLKRHFTIDPETKHSQHLLFCSFFSLFASI